MNVYRLLFLFICTLVASAQLHARPVLVLFPIEVSESDAEYQSDYGSALQEGLQSRYNVFYGPAVEEMLEKEYEKIDCNAERCAQNVALEFNGELIADASAKKMAGGYSLKLVISNVLTGEILETRTHRCRSCDGFSVMDAFERMGKGKKASALKGMPEQSNLRTTSVSNETGKQAVLLFDSNPSNAEIKFNGRIIGRTPYKGLNHFVGEELILELSAKGGAYTAITSIKIEQIITKLNPIILEKNTQFSPQQLRIQQALIGGLSADVRLIASELYSRRESDTKVLDLLAQKAWEQRNTQSPDMADAVAWLCKSLAQSRNPRYRDLLNKLSTGEYNKKITKYAYKGASQLSRSFAEQFVPSAPDSQQLELAQNKMAQQIALGTAKQLRVFGKNYYASGEKDTKTLDQIAQRLWKERFTTNKEMTDAMAWFCKVLANSGSSRYRELLVDVTKTASEGKLRKHAKKSYKAMKEVYVEQYTAQNFQ